MIFILKILWLSFLILNYIFREILNIILCLLKIRKVKQLIKTLQIRLLLIEIKLLIWKKRVHNWLLGLMLRLNIFLYSKFPVQELISEIRFIIWVVIEFNLLNRSSDWIVLMLIITLCNFKVLFTTQTFAVKIALYILFFIFGFYVIRRFVITHLFMFVVWTWGRWVIEFIFLIKVYHFILLQKLINHFQSVLCGGLLLIDLIVRFENDRFFLWLLRIDCCRTII